MSLTTGPFALSVVFVEGNKDNNKWTCKCVENRNVEVADTIVVTLQTGGFDACPV